MKTFQLIFSRTLPGLIPLFFCCILPVYSYANSLKDTSFSDLTDKYIIILPAINYPENLVNLKIAVIPLSAIGKKKIGWNDSRTSMTKETEKEFETELLKCTDGKDKGGAAAATTVKKPLYCERVGYYEGAAGSNYDTHYCSFQKDKMLIVVEFAARWQNCDRYEEAEGKKQCAANKIKLTNAIGRMEANIVSFIKVRKKTAG